MKTLNRNNYLKAKVFENIDENLKKEIIDSMDKFATDYHCNMIKKHTIIEFIFRVILRILGLIPFSLIALFAGIIYILKFIIYYILHGAIAIAYSRLNEYKTVNDFYHLVKKEYENNKI